VCKILPLSHAGELLFAINECSVASCVPLLIQQNVDGSNFFNRSWTEFKVGFNDSSGNYWLGNDLLSELTLNGHYKLKFDLQSRTNTSNWYYAEYSTFLVLSEATNYTLHFGEYSGNAGDSFRHNNSMMFSTYDRDNDQRSAESCAVRSAVWWHNDCNWADVNSAGTGWHAFSWDNLPGGRELQSSRMWLHCK